MKEKEFIDKVEKLGYLKKFIIPVVDECISENFNLNYIYSFIESNKPNLLDLLSDLKRK